MSRGRPPICPICTETVIKEKAYEYKGKYYHNQCFNKFAKQETKDKNNALKEKQKIDDIRKSIEKETSSSEAELSDEEVLDKDKLFKYTKELLDTNILTAKVYALLKNYRSTYKFSYKGMLFALHYFYEILDNPVISDAVGILPHIYDEAQSYLKNREELSEQIKTIDLNQIVQERVINIKKPEKNLIHFIDIDKLE